MSGVEQGDDTSWRVGDVVLDTYEITGLLGEGGMGRVYLARHLSWNLNLAIKCPRREALEAMGGAESFKREAETWVGLGLHPHVVTAFYVRTIDDLPRVFAEYIDGGSLREAIRARRLYAGEARTALGRMLDIAIQIAWGLHHAHSHGIVHQDVKPANVMLNRDGTAMVTDFGLAKARPAAHARHIGQMPGRALADASLAVSVGAMTPAYASPEQWHGKQVSRKTDIWSFAISLLEMFTGEVTWLCGLAAPEVLDSYLEGPFEENIPRMPDELAALIRGCLSLSASERPPDMRGVASALANLYERLVGVSYPRSEPAEGALLADSLNNRAVSLADLGRMDDAEQAFRDARVADVNHLYAAYNHALIRWRTAQITDEEAILSVRTTRGSSGRAWELPYLQAWVHAERGDTARAEQSLKDAESGAGGDVYARTSIAETRRAMLPLNVEPTAMTAIAPVPMLDGAHQIAMSANGRIILAARGNGIAIFDFIRGIQIRQLGTHAEHLAVSPDGRFATLGHCYSVSTLDVQSGRQLSRWRYGYDFTPVFFPAYFQWVQANNATVGAALRVMLEGHISLLRSAPTGYHALSFDTISMGFDNLARWEVIEVAMSGTGSIVVTRQRGGSVVIFDGCGNMVCELWGDGDTAVIAVSHDGCRVGIARDGNVHIYDTSQVSRSRGQKDVRHMRSLHGTHSKARPLRCLRLGCDGAVAVTLDTDDKLRVWDTEGGRCIHTAYTEPKCDLLTIASDARLAIFGEKGGAFFVLRWGAALRVRAPLLVSAVRESGDVLREQQQLAELFLHAHQHLDQGEPLRAIAMLKQIRATPGYERREEVLALWARAARRLKRGRLLEVLPRSQDLTQGNHHGIHALAITPDGRDLAMSCGSDACVYLLDTCGEGKGCTLSMPVARVPQRLAISGDGRVIAAASAEGGVRIWTGDQGAYIDHDIDDHRAANAFALSHDGRLLASIPDEIGIVILYDTRRGRRIRQWSIRHLTYQWATAIAISGNGGLVVVGTSAGRLELLDARRGVRLRSYAVHESAIRTIALDPCATSAVATSADGAVAICQLFSGSSQVFSQRHSGSVNAAAIDQSGTVAWTGGTDGNAKLWCVSSGECIATVSDHVGPIRAVALAVDACMAVTGGADGWVRRYHIDWDIEPPPASADVSLLDAQLDAFLARKTSWLDGGILGRTPAPRWVEADIPALLDALAASGVGWFSREAVEQRLRDRAAIWTGQALPQRTPWWRRLDWYL